VAPGFAVLADTVARALAAIGALHITFVNWRVAIPAGTWPSNARSSLVRMGPVAPLRDLSFVILTIRLHVSCSQELGFSMRGLLMRGAVHLLHARRRLLGCAPGSANPKARLEKACYTENSPPRHTGMLVSTAGGTP